MALWGSFFLLLVVAAVVGVALAIAFAVRQSIVDSRRQYVGTFPVRTSLANVVDKRSEIRGNSGGSTYTTYFTTFELPDGERVEVSLTGQQAGMLMVGDRGTLTWQGPAYQSFQRELMR